MKRYQFTRSTTRQARSRSALGRVVWGAAALGWPGVASASEGGLVLVPDPPLLIALIVLFVLMIVPVNALVFKPLLRVLDEREARIAGTRARAEKIERDATQVLDRYEAAVRATRDEAERDRRSLLEEVRAEVQRETAAARSDAEQRIEQARSEVTSALDGARATLRTQSQELARQAASQVLGRAL